MNYKIIVVSSAICISILIAIYLSSYVPDTIQVCREKGIEKYIERSSSVGIPLGDDGSPSLIIPLGDDIIKEREVCTKWETIPNPEKQGLGKND